MCVYVRTKFQVSNIILTRFIQGWVVIPPPFSPESEPLKDSRNLGQNRVFLYIVLLFYGNLIILLHRGLQFPFLCNIYGIYDK